MANNIGWGQGAVNNNIGWGQGASSNSISWGISQKDSYSGETEIYGIRVDVDALAFYSKVTAAGGTLTATEQAAVNQLVVDLKAKGLWTSMKAIYPMVGASAAACAQNLRSSSFTGTFSSGWTFASTGVTPNGVSAFMNTNLNPSITINNANDGHLSYYSRTESTGSFIDIGTTGEGGAAFDLVIKFSTVAGACINMGDTNVFIYNGTTKGLFVGSQNNTANVRKFFRDNTLIQTQTVAQNSQPNTIISVGARGANFNSFGTNRECAFASIGNGLSDTQSANFYIAVQNFNTTLNRQV